MLERPHPWTQAKQSIHDASGRCRETSCYPGNASVVGMDGDVMSEFSLENPAQSGAKKRKILFQKGSSYSMHKVYFPTYVIYTSDISVKKKWNNRRKELEALERCQIQKCMVADE